MSLRIDQANQQSPTKTVPNMTWGGNGWAVRPPAKEGSPRPSGLTRLCPLRGALRTNSVPPPCIQRTVCLASELPTLKVIIWPPNEAPVGCSTIKA